jgi:hypothetical protein
LRDGFFLLERLERFKYETRTPVSIMPRDGRRNGSFIDPQLKMREQPRHNKSETEFFIDEPSEPARKESVTEQGTSQDALKVDARILDA